MRQRDEYPYRAMSIWGVSGFFATLACRSAYRPDFGLAGTVPVPEVGSKSFDFKQSASMPVRIGGRLEPTLPAFWVA
jgi:hypothetical protein